VLVGDIDGRMVVRFAAGGHGIRVCGAGAWGKIRTDTDSREIYFDQTHVLRSSFGREWKKAEVIVQ
jgi:hypothetical protein